MNDGAGDSLLFRIRTGSDVARTVQALNGHVFLRGASDMDRTLVCTMLSELGTNLVKYADRGTIEVFRREDELGVSIQIDARDRGPGIADIGLATSDHYSTGGTLGLGLPSVRRMADEFEVTSALGVGTHVRVVKRIVHRASCNSSSYPGVPASSPSNGDDGAIDTSAHDMPAGVFDLAVRSRPRDGEVVSGDRALTLACDRGVLLGILDASGHGPTANAVAASLEECFCVEGSSDLERLMRRMDETARGSIGASVGLAFVSASSGDFGYAGVGNTRAAQIGSVAWRGISRDGILGGRRPSVLLQSGRLAARDVLMLWTDGMPESGQQPRKAAVNYRTANEIAAKAMADLMRGYDDAACVVLRWRP